MRMFSRPRAKSDQSRHSHWDSVINDRTVWEDGGFLLSGAEKGMMIPCNGLHGGERTCLYISSPLPALPLLSLLPSLFSAHHSFVIPHDSPDHEGNIPSPACRRFNIGFLWGHNAPLNTMTVDEAASVVRTPMTGRGRGDGETETKVRSCQASHVRKAPQPLPHHHVNASHHITIGITLTHHHHLPPSHHPTSPITKFIHQVKKSTKEEGKDFHSIPYPPRQWAHPFISDNRPISIIHNRMVTKSSPSIHTSTQNEPNRNKTHAR